MNGPLGLGTPSTVTISSWVPAGAFASTRKVTRSRLAQPGEAPIHIKSAGSTLMPPIVRLLELVSGRPPPGIWPFANPGFVGPKLVANGETIWPAGPMW